MIVLFIDLFSSSIPSWVAVWLLSLALFVAMAIFNVQKAKQEEATRQRLILAHQDQWGMELCQKLINGEISAGMTQLMVQLAWGSPTSKEYEARKIDADTVHWVYALPSGDTRQVWFDNTVVTQVKS
jgi:hypothetical protein